MFMNVSFTTLTIFAAGILVFAISCQPTNNGESKSSWQLKSPGTASGYGRSPLDTNGDGKILSAPPASEVPPSMKAPAPEQPTTKSDGPQSAASSWKIAPPPSAARYGRPPLDTNEANDAPPGPPAGENRQQEAAPAMNEPASQQPTTGSHKPVSATPALKIAPPPSAPGYGRSPLDSTGSKDTSPEPPAAENSQQDATPTMNKSAPAPQKPAIEDDGTKSPAPIWKILPPPSAAGYGK